MLTYGAPWDISIIAISSQQLHLFFLLLSSSVAFIFHFAHVANIKLSIYTLLIHKKISILTRKSQVFWADTRRYQNTLFSIHTHNIEI